jgi:lia operon protein LiaF
LNGKFTSRLFTGLVVIGVGLIFLLKQTGYIEFNLGDAIRMFWPVILIVVGIRGLLTVRDYGYGSLAGGLVPLIIGIVFLGRNLDWFEWSIGELVPYIWPIIIIIVGINLIWRPKWRKSKPPEDDWKSYGSYDDQAPIPPAPPLHPDPTKEPINLSKEPLGGTDNSGLHQAESKTGYQGYGNSFKEWKKEQKNHYKHWEREQKDKYKNKKTCGSEHVEWWNSSDPSVQTRSGFIGDIHIGQDYWDLKPMNISHFIGDTVLDLTKAHVATGETKVCISSFIGDVKVFVPNDFEVGIEVVSSAFIGDVKVLGRKEGGMFNHFNMQSPRYAEADKRIKLIVSTFIGDVRVTKVG